MKKIAIVGTSRVKENQESAIHSVVIDIFNSMNDKFMVMSGGAQGVDTIVARTAREHGLEIMEYTPEQRTWDGFKRRNIKMAIECDELYCLSLPVWTEKCYHHDPPQNHQKTAGCWTMNRALDMGKKCRFYKV